MFKQFSYVILVLLFARCFAYAQAKERIYGGVGYAASATTTPQEFVFEQPAGDNLISTGDFASDTNWTKGAGWVITAGAATYTNAATATNSLIQSSISVSTGSQYRLTYTVSGIVAGDGVTLTPSLGNDALTARTADGTYTEDFYFAGTASLAFQIYGTNAGTRVTNSIDNVYVYPKPNPGWVDVLNLSGTTGVTTVHFLFNCTANDFTNTYNAGRTMQLTSDNNPLYLDFGGQKTPIYKMWYRAATGTESFVINAR